MIKTGAIIGIIGGGQLGKMMAIAAAELGYLVHIFTDEKDSPASHVSCFTTVAKYSDKDALRKFAHHVDVITFEFENIPHESVEILEKEKPVFPGSFVLKTARNRIREKTFVNDLGIGTAAFHKIMNVDDLRKAIKDIGVPSILKTTELGYDGKGQAVIKTENAEEFDTIWRSLNTSEAILESFVDFVMEISVIVARGEDGKAITYVPVQNIHKHHILDVTIAPAPIDKNLADKAESIAVKIAEALNLRGLLAVEMFVTRDNKILVNELAPRPHNSGHWTMDACITGQFEQIIRAVTGLPLGDPNRLCDAKMKNLIGDEVLDLDKYLADNHAKIHLYGKKEVRAGRKMGHVNILLPKS